MIVLLVMMISLVEEGVLKNVILNGVYVWSTNSKEGRRSPRLRNGQKGRRVKDLNGYTADRICMFVHLSDSPGTSLCLITRPIVTTVETQGRI